MHMIQGQNSNIFQCKSILGITFFLISSLFFTFSTTSAEILHFDRIGELQGLTKKTITCGLQDRQGYLWFGSEDGLLRYDGYTFQEYVYNPQDPKSISSNLIYSILEDSKGIIWVGTVGGGLNMFDPATGKFKRYQNIADNPNSLSHNGVISLMEDSKGNLWIGTEGGGLNRLDSSRTQFTLFHSDVNIENTVSFDSMWHLYEDSAGTIWIGTHGGGLNQYDPETERFTHYRHIPNDPTTISSDTVGAILEDRSGNLWVGSTNGLNKLDRQTGTFSRYEKSNEHSKLPHNHIWDLYEDESGTIWIGSFGGGVIRFDPTTEMFSCDTHIPADNLSLSSNLVWFVLESRDGIMWFGTDGGGLNKFIKRTEDFHHFSATPSETGSLLYSGINDVASGQGSILWLANDGGGFQSFDLNSKEAKLFRHDPGNSNSLGSDLTEAILVDSSGVVWIGTYNGGLSAYNQTTGRFTNYTHSRTDSTSLSDNRIWSLFEDSQGNLWVGTRNGLNLLGPDRKTFKRYFHSADNPHSISDNGIWVVYEDSNNTIWVGTDNGLNRMKFGENSFVHYFHDSDDPASLSHNNVTTIFQDSQGSLWIGTNGGLSRMNSDEKTFHNITAKEGLGSNSIRGIIEDKNHNLWITTVNGLSHLDRKTGRIHTYDKNDGLQGREFSKAHCLTGDGRIVIGGRNGINVFQPELIERNSHVAPLVITELKINNKVVNDQKLNTKSSLSIDYFDNSISFEFAALDYNNPSANSYSYKLEGFDSDWIDAGTRRTATYTNLDGGRYSFLVKGANNHGTWNQKGLQIDIAVTNPPWKRWWAFILYGVVFFAFLYGFVERRAYQHKLRIKAVQKINEDLQKEVSERKRIEDALTISEQRLNMALEAAQEAIWDFYPQSGETYFSPAWYTILGYAPNTFPNSYETWVNLLHPEDRPKAQSFIESFIADQKTSFNIEFRMLAKDGGYRWIQAKGKTFEKDADGNITRMSGIHLDITERKKWQNSLEESERRYRNLFDNAPVMYVIAKEKDGDAVITDANSTFLEALGYTHEEVINTLLKNYYSLESSKLVANGKHYKQIIDGTFQPDERTLVTKDGHMIHTLLHALPEIDENGEVSGIRAMFLDISTRKHAEQETKRLESALQQSQKMEAIGTLAGGIAHDFNNILAAIIGYCELLLLESKEDSPQTAKLKQIHLAGIRAKDLVQQILTFSRRDERMLKHLRLAPLIKEAIKLLRSSLPTTIKIVMEIEDSEIAVQADPTQIHQIVMNLCTNGAQAMPDGGELTVSLNELILQEGETVHFPELPRGRYVQLTVKDTGEGVPEEVQDSIFNPYFTTKSKGKGTGLGLAVVHGIVQSYGGTIALESRPHEGAIFKVIIPALEGDYDVAEQHDTEIIGGNEHILFVDDEPTLVEMNTEILTSLGYKVTSMTSSHQALEKFKLTPDLYDVLITDMTMPEMTGDLLAKSIKSIRPNIPAILLSGYSEKLLDHTIEDLGVDILLNKPVEKTMLASAIREALEKKIV